MSTAATLRRALAVVRPRCGRSPRGRFLTRSYSEGVRRTTKAVRKTAIHRGFWVETESPSSWTVESSSESLLSESELISLGHPELRQPVLLHRPWLRDACQCDVCVDPSSGQKRFATVDVPGDLPVSNAVRCEDGSLEITWENDFHTHGTHVSRYPRQEIEAYFSKRENDPQKRRLWDREVLESLNPFYGYTEFMDGKADYLSAMATLRSHGAIFLRNVPLSKHCVELLAFKIGILQHTFYGKSWDVWSKPDAENVAYTSSYLGLHQDLLYMGDPPRIQLLHCLKNTCQGGESLFSDGLRAGSQLKSGFPHMLGPLAKQRVGYHYQKGEHHYHRDRTILNEYSGAAYWSPPFQTPWQPLKKTPKGIEHYKAWKEAARKFKSLLEQEEYVYEYKMKEGECAIFDNLRVLHGRRQFDTSTGERWLRGAYVGNDSFKGKLHSLNNALPRAQYPHIVEQAMGLLRT
ncbi:Uu.00g006060.m01.CDS01 [Anthostomella pinea]|uniref:Uu.00g006060.m01.CDS01 n=1 Tax=Anthostomella pinea TaxID=933095 RepID=A0AAI8VL78_9PEZI|nr:Uu.00g006060.m01.CDS01 [Anthostomella pinea]